METVIALCGIAFVIVFASFVGTLLAIVIERRVVSTFGEFSSGVAVALVVVMLVCISVHFFFPGLYGTLWSPLAYAVAITTTGLLCVVFTAMFV